MTETAQRDRARLNIAILVTAALWIGVMLGVSFLATPAKFLAPSLSLTTALDVGRYTFAVFNKVEWCLSIGLLALLAAHRHCRLSAICAGVIIVLVVLETLWLLPVLDARTGLILNGQQTPPSYHHSVYVGFEIAKLIGLCLVVADMARRMISHRAGAISQDPTGP